MTTFMTNAEKLQLIKTTLTRTLPDPLRKEEFRLNNNIIVLSRFTVKLRIMKALNIRDRHTITNWINTLLSQNIIAENPTSAYTPNLRKHMPTDDTRYIIYLEKCATHPHTPATPLDNWTNQLSEDN